MTDDESSLMGLGMELRDGLQEMIENGRLTEYEMPNDFQWLQAKLAEMATLCQRVRADDDC